MDDPFYHPIYEQAKSLQYKFHDVVNDAHHPAANILRNEIHKLVEDIEVKKNPRTIEDRLKIIQRQLKEVEHQSHPVMHYEHADYLHTSYEHMRQNLRKFDNY